MVTIPSTRHPSTLIPPVPCVSTFAATVFSPRGLRATVIGSSAGFSAVPQPSHCFAASVAGAVIKAVFDAPIVPVNAPIFVSTKRCGLLAEYLPGTPASRSAPAALSIALLTSNDFGNPLAYTHAIISRISNPASSILTAIRCCVRVPANASKCPPGFNTRRHSRQMSSLGTS